MLIVETSGRTCRLTLNRPAKRNSLHPEMISTLVAELTRINGDRETRVVVLTGAGESFSAGLDLHHLAGLNDVESVNYMRSAFALFRQVYELRQPVIAAVNGPAIAGGFDLAAFCDIRLCSSNARFAQTEILLGLTQIIYPIYKVIGLSRAKELALTGRSVSAEEAHSIGLVNNVYSQEELLPKAQDLAEELSSRPPEALFETKRLGRVLIEMDTGSAMSKMLEVICRRLRSDEHKEAVQSYVARLGSKQK